VAKLKSVVCRSPWAIASVLFAVLLFRGVVDPFGSQVDRLTQFIWLGVGFGGVMGGVGVVSRLLGRHSRGVLRAADWIFVVIIAWFAGLLLGYLAVVENVVICVDPSGDLTDCNSSVIERLVLMGLSIVGWAGGTWAAQPWTRRGRSTAVHGPGAGSAGSATALVGRSG
jgi:hypothetical protein